ncbi:Anaphase-promoting complex subunit 1 [Datura stramonium]|uniref:Anaphase-promoting complex subunit 1 n=1 Tax=Datura stramonium TaxID=4076 RepID=A0ABS8RPJ1_DATST|nr:Anaphase-promoting complex subunit 1 [Datura stramonium]
MIVLANGLLFSQQLPSSVGLLYEGSAHPQTMQILLGEIGRRSGGDNVLEREGYAVAAGSCGEDAPGFVDALVDRLFQYIGGKEPENERFHLFVPSNDELNRSAGQIMDGTSVNVDVTAPGATIALCSYVLKTESELVYSRLSVPQIFPTSLNYVRPDFIMLRGFIALEFDYVEQVIQNGVKGLGDTASDTDEINADAFVQAYVYIVVGACISLLGYDMLVVEMAIYKSCSTNMLCTSLMRVWTPTNIQVVKIFAWSGVADGHLSCNQMAVSLAIGFLFIGGGMQTFSTSKSSIAALLITLYPRLPTGPNDNRCHLQGEWATMVVRLQIVMASSTWF